MKGSEISKQDAEDTQYESVDNLIECFSQGNNLYWVLSMFVALPKNEDICKQDEIGKILKTLDKKNLRELKANFKEANLYKQLEPHFDTLAEFVYPLIY